RPYDVDATSTSYQQHGWDIHALEPGGPGRRARITSHDSASGAQQHQEATPRRGAAAQDQLKQTALRSYDVAGASMSSAPGTDGARVTKVRSDARAGVHRGN